MTSTRGPRLAARATLALAFITMPAHAARPQIGLGGSWVGDLELGRVQSAPAVVAAALQQSKARISGTITLSGLLAAGTFSVAGIARAGGARLNGVHGGQLLRWRARWYRKRRVWSGRLRLRNGSVVLRGRLALWSSGGGPASGCGAEYFAQELMPTLLEPVCGQCHVAGGAAASTRWRVTPGDPATTALSAAALVDAADPSQSLLLRKPRGDVPHTGGILVPAGSAAEQSMLHWISLITPPLCTGGPGTGGSGDLFTDNCASCHGPDAAGTAAAPNIRCATRVADAVRVGRGAAMPTFPALSDADVALLQAALDTVCTAGGRTGSDLYTGNCSTCHGTTAGGGRNALGVDGPDVRCNRRIAEPVRNGEDDMPAFPGLSDADIAAVQQYLAASACPADATGADLYAGNCFSCHGADARGTGTRPDIRCHRGIANAVRTGRQGAGDTMPAFTSMLTSEIGLVQGYLLELCPPGSASGAELYTTNCAACHGGDASGGAGAPSVRCATRVADAVQIGRGERMPSFAAFAPADLTALGGRLDQLCTAAGRTGADLYAGNCLGCHGASAQGGRDGLGVHGPDIRCTGAGDYLEKVQQGDDEMPAFPGLEAAAVDAIVTFVHAAYCPGG